MRYWIVITCIWVLSAVGAFASVTDTPLVEAFSKGYAITADTIGLEGASKNPATVQLLAKNTSIFNINSISELTITHGFVGVGYTLNSNTWVSFTFPFTLSSKIKETTIQSGTASEVGSFSSFSSNPRVTLTRALSKSVTIGLSAVGLYDTLEKEAATGFSFDCGAVIQIKKLRLGAALQDIGWNKSWSTETNESKDISSHLGASVAVLSNMDLQADRTQTQDSVIHNVGAQFRLMSIASLSAGIRDIGQTNQYRAGAMIKIDDVSVSYAYGSHLYLSESHKVGVAIDF